MRSVAGIPCLQSMVKMRDGAGLNTFVYLPPTRSFCSVRLRALPNPSRGPIAPTAGCRAADAPMRGSILRAYRSIVAHGLRGGLTGYARTLRLRGRRPCGQPGAGEVTGRAGDKPPCRTVQYPDLPTIGETVKGDEFISWMDTFVPTGTPRPIVGRLNAEFKEAVADPSTLHPLPL